MVSEKLTQRIENAVIKLGDPSNRRSALKYAKELHAEACNGFHLNPNERFELMLLCLHAAGFRLQDEYDSPP